MEMDATLQSRITWLLSLQDTQSRPTSGVRSDDFFADIQPPVRDAAERAAIADSLGLAISGDGVVYSPSRYAESEMKRGDFPSVSLDVRVHMMRQASLGRFR